MGESKLLELNRLRIDVLEHLASLDGLLRCHFSYLAVVSLFSAIWTSVGARRTAERTRPSPVIGRRGLFASDRRRSTTETRTIKQASPESILKMVEHYDVKRRVLDAMIQEANHAVDIAWPPKQ